MRIALKFDELRARNERALILFVTAGNPTIDELPAILDALQEGGADIIEVGIPFSDPIADGAIIQASSQRALDNGVTPSKVFEALTKSNLRVPVITMGYYNTFLRLGLDESAKGLKDCGVSGTIISDLTPEEASEWISASKAEELDNVFLAAPTSTDERLDAVCKLSSGFVYAVSRTGVTGSGSQVPADVQSLVRRIKAKTQLPVCVGFGISTPEHLKMVCEVADGAVIGSWLVDQIAKTWNGGKGKEALVSAVKQLKMATQVA